MTRTALLLAACARGARLPCTVAAGSASSAAPAVPLKNGAEISNGSATIRVIAITNSILRVRIARGRAFPEDASWAVPAEVRAKSVRVEPLANGFETAALNVAIDPETLALTVSDRQGRRIHTDAAKPISFDGNALHAAQDDARRRAILWARRQDRPVQPARRELRPLEHRRLGLRSRNRPDLQVDPLHHRERRPGRRLRPVPRQ